MAISELEKFRIAVQAFCFKLVDSTQAYYETSNEIEYKEMLLCADFLFDNFLGPNVLYLDLRHPYITTEYVNGEYVPETVIAGGIIKRAKNVLEKKYPRQRLIEPEDLATDISPHQITTLKQVDESAAQYFSEKWENFI